MLRTVLSVLAIAVMLVGVSCDIKKYPDRNWDGGPCDDNGSCFTNPGAYCRKICWSNENAAGGVECQYQYFKRVICEVGK